ncbi:DUF2834 domain-containing protein [Sinimarinibacterium thermocellulolyticum]|uniref:DUF2834 domain-containing protein n=1 Tax=Sinimarinibacterium thermocellulolyticum TaxID=3170016 RepID=A0ABV2ADB8_9GAMM
MNRTIALVVLGLITLDFAALTVYALMEHGYVGLFAYQLATPAGWQVLADLVIVCLLAMAWMIADARRSGRTVWPYLLLTVFGGSFGPLLYLLVGLLDSRPDARPVLG